MSTAITAVIHECPQCGAPAQLNSNVCSYCKSEFIIKSLSGLRSLGKVGIDKYIASYKKAATVEPNNTELNAAMGMCYLKLGVYDFAIKFFEKAMVDMIENSEVYFYAAIAHFKGKRPFLALLPTIRKVEELVGAAISISPEGKYYFLLSIIQSDYYDKKKLNSKYTYQELLHIANKFVIANDEIEEIHQYVPAPR